VKTMHFTNSEKDTYQLQPGDILLNEGQSLELVRRSAIYNEQPGKFFFQNTLIRFRPGPRVKSRFAQEVFTHWLASGRFSGIAKQTTSIA
ncbi:restriction endonuclease subunit S, partial [Streptomyces daliensis]|nr:restriction endonuclease subunit S [Streptomyces daliensis]